MNYYLNIIDTVDDSHFEQLKKAERGSLVLSWEGADRRDELAIVGSNLDFSLEVSHDENEDAKYIDLFTGNEQRFRVELRRELDDVLLWKGFLLPDSYREPYRKGTYFVNFSATDGLGLLKGKYLPSEFYYVEKSVIQILCACLKLTGLDYDLYFTPAINNVANNWDEIYLSGKNFLKDGERKTAYEILESVVPPVLLVYQDGGRWNVEGVNNRHSLSYLAQVYDGDANRKSDVVVQRVIKSPVFFANPDVDVIPPIGGVKVNFETPEVQFPKGVAKEEDVKWNTDYILNSDIIADDWVSSNPDVRLMKSKDSDYAPIMRDPLWQSQFAIFSLRNPIFLKGGKRYTVKMGVEIINYIPELQEELRKQWGTEWRGYGDVRFFLNGKSVSSYGDNRFGISASNKSASISYPLYVVEDSLFNLEFSGGVKDNSKANEDYDPHFDGVIKELSIELEEEDSQVFHLVNNANYSSVKEVDLPFVDYPFEEIGVYKLAKTQFNQGRYLYSVFSGEISQYYENGKYVYALPLEFAVMLFKNKENVVYRATGQKILQDFEIQFNYYGSDEMVLLSTVPLLQGEDGGVRELEIPVYSLDESLLSKYKDWYSWRDAKGMSLTYRYAEVVASIFKNLGSSNQYAIAANCSGRIGFLDLIRFNYLGSKLFEVNNLSWNIDEGISKVMLQNIAYGFDVGDTIKQEEVIVHNLPNEVRYEYEEDGVYSFSFECFSLKNDLVFVSVEKVSGNAVLVSKQPRSFDIRHAMGDTVFLVCCEDVSGGVVKKEVKFIGYTPLEWTVEKLPWTHETTSESFTFENYSSRFFIDQDKELSEVGRLVEFGLRVSFRSRTLRGDDLKAENDTLAFRKDLVNYSIQILKNGKVVYDVESDPREYQKKTDSIWDDIIYYLAWVDEKVNVFYRKGDVFEVRASGKHGFGYIYRDPDNPKIVVRKSNLSIGITDVVTFFGGQPVDDSVNGVRYSENQFHGE